MWWDKQPKQPVESEDERIAREKKVADKNEGDELDRRYQEEVARRERAAKGQGPSALRGRIDEDGD